MGIVILYWHTRVLKMSNLVVRLIYIVLLATSTFPYTFPNSPNTILFIGWWSLFQSGAYSWHPFRNSLVLLPVGKGFPMPNQAKKRHVCALPDRTMDSLNNLSCILHYSHKALGDSILASRSPQSCYPEAGVVRPYLIWTGGSYSQRSVNPWRGDTSTLSYKESSCLVIDLLAFTR